jgi:hypothetical protein
MSRAALLLERRHWGNYQRWGAAPNHAFPGPAVGGGAGSSGSSSSSGSHAGQSGGPGKTVAAAAGAERPHLYMGIDRHCPRNGYRLGDTIHELRPFERRQQRQHQLTSAVPRRHDLICLGLLSRIMLCVLLLIVGRICLPQLKSRGGVLWASSKQIPTLQRRHSSSRSLCIDVVALQSWWGINNPSSSKNKAFIAISARHRPNSNRGHRAVAVATAVASAGAVGEGRRRHGDGMMSARQENALP